MEAKTVVQTLLISAAAALVSSAVKTVLSSTRMPWKKVGKRFNDLKRRLPRGSPLAERVAKIAVIVVFTVCWLLIVLVRSHHGATDPTAIEGSSLPALATALQQRAISGRDFQSIYGPATQLLAWIATSVTVTRSALAAYGM